MPEIKFKITNLTCESCVKLSVLSLNKINSVNKVEVDLVTGFSKVNSDQVISFNEIQKVLEAVDKKAVILN